MSNVIDISSKITNALPIVKITDDIVVTVNNRKSTVLNIQLMIKEQEKKVKEGEGADEFTFMEKALIMIIGKKSVDSINKMDLPVPEYKIVYNAVMAAASGQSQEDFRGESAQ